MPSGQERLPYWQVNVPADQRSDECPDFLKDANEKDQKILATPDSEFRRLLWPEVQELIRTNRIDLFQRVPSDLRRYKAYTAKLKNQYGSVMNFVMTERLRWQDLVPQGEPFSNPDDVKILLNDWPYGIDTRIVHLVVWVKFQLEEDPVSGDLTDAAREQLDSYVNQTFRAHVGAEDCIWFKNWASLKSIHAVEHFHVMLFSPDKQFVDDITNGDVALSDKIRIDV
ncbi:hypothetical protein E4T50_13841 [Aureobasidium sp. EXF-12298]|nr:hypothetical protein E4T50_13841 [Aureobasidium sp. EXF-12298]KAI4756168.1 hypothetical protein E4T51_10730 [Aureobasidium sp. EXF-12344]KAI4777957.1 hypothetical protein E4T52_07073 [Aureobasidium sp. EXF-3400]